MRRPDRLQGSFGHWGILSAVTRVTVRRDSGCMERGVRMSAPRAGPDVAGEHEFQGDFVGGGGEAEADAGLDAGPFGLMIEDAPELVSLLVGGKEAAELASVGIFLGGDGPSGIEIVGDAGAGCEVEAFETAGPGIIENGVDNDVPGMQMQANDGANLGSERARVPVGGVVAEFEIRGVEEFAIGGVRRGEEQADFAAIDFRAGGVCDAVERKIKTALEPILEAVGQF